MDRPTFLTNFPEFGDENLYPMNTIDFYLNLAQMTVDPNLWQDRADYGTGLFIAHHLVLEARAGRSAAFGGLPGQTQGVVNGKGVGGVSQGFDTAAVTVEGDGHWNETHYGVRFMSICRIVGAGGLLLL